MLPDPSLLPGTDRIPQIRHIVLLMMENHSFDNYLGTLGRGDGLPSPAPVNRPTRKHAEPIDWAHLPLPSLGVFPGGVEFEAQRSAGVRGYKPNLDLVAEPAGSDWLFAESKCLEYLRPHRTAFSDAFPAKADKFFLSKTAFAAACDG